MKINLTYRDQHFECDLGLPLDISIPIGHVRCFYAPPYEATPYTSGNFIGSVNAGSPVNFYNVKLNPHGQGTHTEGFGHITAERKSINDILKEFHFIAQLVSVPLEEDRNGDMIINAPSLRDACPENIPEGLIIRTLPNTDSKRIKDYSGTNPPYLTQDAMQFIVDQNVQHLLLDLPSVDKEEDEGRLTAHRKFWNLTNEKKLNEGRKDCTITELVFIQDEIEDGLYLVNLQIPSLELDAAPSKPVLYKLKSEDHN